VGRQIKSISDVVEYQLCTGCGVCAYIEPKRFRMGDSLEHGRRPFLVSNPANESGEALKVCPGAVLAHSNDVRTAPGIKSKQFDEWGPVYGVWEGFATDPEIRFAGSSGGAATALALYCLERAGMTGVLHTAAQASVPYLNETVLSTSRSELLARTGSRYAPASPAERLAIIEKAQGATIFIGKPCDVAAVSNARRMRPQLDEKIGLVIAFFCAGTPSLQGALDLIANVGIADPETVTSLRYRGNGWPGLWTARHADSAGQERVQQRTYQQSWGFLQKYRQWRCYICPDHTGEFADVAVGDPWYRSIQPDEPGKSLIIARTKHGLDIIRAAAEAGYIVLETEDDDLLPRSQPNLSATKGALWGRLMVLRLLGAAVPDFRGFSLFRLWLRNLSAKQKFQSLSGTAKRVFSKRLRTRTYPVEWHSLRERDDS